MWLKFIEVIEGRCKIYNLQNKCSFMDGARVGSEYAISTSNRRKKIEIISTNKVESFKRQHYYESNPYSLNRNPSTPFLHRTHTTPEAHSNRDNLTETSSQKSTKVVRTNGLTKAEKPNITPSKVTTRPIAHRANGLRVGPAICTGYGEQDPMGLYQQYGIGQASKQGQKNSHQAGSSTEEERRLKQENTRLKEQVMRMEKSHSEEIMSLKEQMERIFRLVADLEERMKLQEKDWQQYISNK